MIKKTLLICTGTFMFVGAALASFLPTYTSTKRDWLKNLSEIPDKDLAPAIYNDDKVQAAAWTGEPGTRQGYGGEGSESDNSNNCLWSGLALQYYLYKNSDVSSNTIIKNWLTSIKKNIDGNNNLDDKYFYMGVISGIITVSGYANTCYQEFWAESYTKWLTTPDAIKNKSWALLNHFFVDIYPTLLKSYNGYLSFGQDNSVILPSKLTDFIDNDYNTNNTESKKSNYYYYTIGEDFSNATNKFSNAGDLYYKKYGNDYAFGLTTELVANQNTNPAYIIYSIVDIDSAISYYRYQNAIAYSSANNIFGTTNMGAIKSWEKETGIYISDPNIGYFKTIMNDSLIKADDSSKTEFNTFISKSKKDYFNTFDDLDSKLTGLTLNGEVDNTTGDDVSNISWKKAIDAMTSDGNWDSSYINDLKDQLILLYDSTLELCDFSVKDSNKDTNLFLYYLIGIVIGPGNTLNPDGDSNAKPTNTLAFTSNYITDTRDTNTFAYIAYTQSSLQDYRDPKNNQQYQLNWWSSPNNFTTLDHEFGHALDGFLGTITNYRKQMIDSSEMVNKNYNINSLYKGDKFGYGDYSAKPNSNKNSDLAKYIVFGSIAVAGVVGTVVIVSIMRKRRRG
ncbi:hypothetical protein [Spiroplasma endosymbiont of Aspidapion aeneum]|uniref:hypothetical protein n=1 Tax=Spiroplasma endosymbiont of Aspidapion aeneum TaxID=3066276 RepID=UPI00313B8A31